MSRASYRIGFVLSSNVEISKVSYDLLPPVRERTLAMDAAVKGIHGNEVFSLENVARSVREAVVKKQARR